MSEGEINPTEVVSALIDQEDSFKDGILRAQETIDGFCTMLVKQRYLRSKRFL